VRHKTRALIALILGAILVGYVGLILVVLRAAITISGVQ